MHSRTTAAALALFFALACTRGESGPATLAEGDVVKVERLVKGDEVVVTKDEREARVRQLGIYVFSAVVSDPQVRALSAGGTSALEELVRGKTVKLAFDRTVQDEAGRYLAYLELDGTDVGRRMVEEGWAVVYTEYPFAREGAYLAAETMARAKGRSLWGLKPASDLVRGLRRQWLETRRARGGAAPADALMAETP